MLPAMLDSCWKPDAMMNGRSRNSSRPAVKEFDNSRLSIVRNTLAVIA